MNQLERFLALVLLSPLLGFSFILRALGLGGLAVVSGAMGRLFYRAGFRRKVVDGNVELALGKELSSEQRRDLVQRIYKNVALTFLEIARNFALGRTQMAGELEIGPAERARLDAIVKSGRGAVFISAHIANWELLAMGVAAHGYPVAVIVKRMSSRISQSLIEWQRTKTGLEVIYSGGTLQKMKAALARGKLIGFMVDQHMGGHRGIRVNYFGVPAASIRGLAGFVKETRCLVVPVCALRDNHGGHRFYMGPELPYLEATDLPDGSEERRLREEWLNTQQYQKAIEDIVRAHPEQWLWIHRRWKCDRTPLDPARAHLG